MTSHIEGKPHPEPIYNMFYVAETPPQRRLGNEPIWLKIDQTMKDQLDPLEFPLTLKRQHLFITNEVGRWVYDTGSPASFGKDTVAPLSGREIKTHLDMNGTIVDADSLTDLIGVRVVGLIGTDELNLFDHLIDLRPNQMKLTASKNELHTHDNTLAVSIDLLHGALPYLTATVGNQTGRYIFDTGAQLSYHVGPIPMDATPCTPADDFWIPIGEFHTETYHASVNIQNKETRLRFGVPPKKLADGHTSMKIQGIIGNEIMIGCYTGYFPRRGKLHLKL